MKEDFNITISSGTIVKTLSWIAVFAGLFYVNDFVIAFLVAIVLASAVEMPLKVMVKWGIPRIFSVIIIFLSFIVFVGVVAFIFIPPSILFN